jgi:hypothetical protein
VRERAEDDLSDRTLLHGHLHLHVGFLGQRTELPQEGDSRCAAAVEGDVRRGRVHDEQLRTMPLRKRERMRENTLVPVVNRDRTHHT